MSSPRLLTLLLFASVVYGQNADPGRPVFESRCSRCHGSDGKGGEMGPSIVARLPSHNDKELSALIHDGIPQKGMPPNVLPETEMANVVSYLRRIQTRPGTKQEQRKVQTTDGKT